MPTPEQQRRRTRVALFLSAWAVAVSFTVAGWSLIQRFSDTNEKRAAQIAQTARIEAIAYHECLDIEKLKKIQRDDALKNYRQLDRNGKLLGIKITPELRKAAKEDRDDKLRKFAPKDCHNPLAKPKTLTNKTKH